MHFTRIAAAAFAGAALMASPAHADDVATLRHDLDAMRQDYEARIAALEQRLAEAEAANTAPVTVDQPEAAPPPPPVNTNPNIYNPGIAVALNGFLTGASEDTGAETIAGFAPGDEIGRPERGFSLGESEISFAANIDPSLAGFMAISVNNANEIGLEEAYIRTTALPYGLTLKAGRFLSGIAYLNERHLHDMSFEDTPLPYRAFLNTQLGDDGVQLRWIAPTNQFLEFGVEALRGDAYPAAGSANNGIGTYTAFVHTGADLNVSSSYLAALSYVHANAIDRESNGDLFTGDSDVAIASLIYKWAPGGNPLVRNLTIAGEYFWGRDNGQFNGIDVDQAHTGWYVQGVYQFMPQWSAGLRVAGLNSDDPGAALIGAQLDDFGHSPMDYTALLEFDTSEFGRLRLQYTHDDAGLQSNDVVSLAYTVIYGPHGAHRY